MITTEKAPSPDSVALVAELRQLIDSARQRTATAINAELAQLYWQVGNRIHREILGGQRARYGEEIIAVLERQRLERTPLAPVRALCPDLPRRRNCAHAVCRIELVAFAPGRSAR